MRALLLAVAVSSVGCRKPSPPTVTLEKVALTGINAQGITLDLSLAATNPNPIDVTASRVSSHVVVGGKYDVGTVSLPKEFVLPAGKTTNLDVPIATKWSDLGVLAQLAATSRGVPYSVDGTLEMGGALLRVSVPFHFDGTIPHAQIVAAMVSAVPLPR